MAIPCEETCPMCGSDNVCRRFFKKDESTGVRASWSEEGPFSKYVRCHGPGTNYWATRDFIHHVCRCCQYKWQTKTLKAQATNPHTASEEPSRDHHTESPTHTGEEYD